MDTKQHKKQIRKYIRWACLVLVVVLLAVMPLLASRSVEADGPQATILTATAGKRSITTRLIGGGQLASDATEEITIPAQIKLTKYLVGNGDNVKKGDPIARVDKVSVMTALQEVQKTLDYLSKQLSSASSDTQPDTVKARSGGTVKILYAETGDNVRDVMLRHGALAVLSLDGRMALDIPCEIQLFPGTLLPVTLEDGTVLDGRVEAAQDGTLTVSVEDDNYPVGLKAAVSGTDGKTLGSGELYIHSPWNATAYAGTITAVNTQENTRVSSGKVLFRLETAGHSAQFQILTEQRRDYEELMVELFAMYDSGVITAPCDGFVTGVDEDAAFLLATAPEQTYQILLLNGENPDSPDSDDPDPDPDPEDPNPENPDPDPDDPDSENPDPDPDDPEQPPACTKQEGCEAETHDPDCPEYKPHGGYAAVVESITEAGAVLKYISSVDSQAPENPFFAGTKYPDGSPIAVGDVVILHLDGSIRKVSGGPGDIQMPNLELDLSGMMGMMGGFGGFAGMGGGMDTAQTFTPYALDEITVASVTSQEQMTLEITVDELDISRLSPGMDASVTVEALPGQSFHAVVTSISNTGINAGGSSKFTAKLTLEKSIDMLPGMHASAYLELDTETDVLSVPVAALTESGAQVILHTGYDEKNELLSDPVIVTTGISDGEYVQIVSGLAEGDTVYYAYYDTASDSHIPERGLGF